MIEFSLGIPQIIYIVCSIMSLVNVIINHDKPRDNHNAYLYLFNLIIVYWILIAGGFFDGK